MSDKIHLKVFLNITVDLNELWKKLCLYPGAHLGGEAGYYTVVFDGQRGDGIKVLSSCLEASDSGKFYADYGA